MSTIKDSTVDVVVVTYNSADVIEGLLASLPDAFSGISYRVIVVDNDSTDETSDVLAGRTDLTLVRSENRGYGAGINLGVRSASGDGPILVLNPDVRLQRGAVPALLETLESSGCGVAVPLLLEADGSTARSLRREPTLARSMGLGDSRYPRASEVVNEPAAYARAHPVDWATGAVMLVSRSCFDRLGGFDEGFFMYSEETDFSLRARDIGLTTLFTPAAAALHIGAASGSSPDLYAMQVLNRVRLYRRRNPFGRSLLLYLLTAAREAVFAARRDPASQRALASLVRPSRKPHQLPWPGSPLRRSEPGSRHERA